MPIREDVVTHGTIASSLYDWKPSSAIATAFLVAVLTTVLAYKLTAIFTDLLLGAKPPNTASAPALYSVLLATDSFPISALVATLHRQPRHCLPRRHITLLNLTRLALLLFIPTLFNIVSILLTLEFDHSISFSDASFAGVALSVNSDFSRVKTYPFAGPCELLATRFTSNNLTVPEFYLCRFIDPPKPLPDFTSPSPFVRIRTNDRAHIIVELPDPFFIHSYQVYADVRAGGQLLRIAHNLRIHDAKLLVSRAKFLMCGPSEKSDQYNATDEFDVSEKDGLISVQAPLNCSHESKGLNNLDPIARQLTDAVTLVNAPIMRVAKFVERPTHRIRTTQFFDAANMELLTIRTSVISLPIMAICVAVVLIASIAVKFITNNDVHEGLEAIVKSRQLMSPESSLLFNNDMVSYCQKQNHDVVSGCDAGVRENGDDIDS